MSGLSLYGKQGSSALFDFLCNIGKRIRNISAKILKGGDTGRRDFQSFDFCGILFVCRKDSFSQIF